MRIRISLFSLSILALILVGCSGDSGSSDSDTSQQQPTQNVVAEADQPTDEQTDPTPTAETVDIGAQAATPEVSPTETTAPTQAATVAEPATIDRPDWQMIEFTNSRTGDTFSFADYAGKTIYVEPMATWCPICTSQLGDVAAVREQLGTDDYVFIGLSLETYLDPADLASHADSHGWEWAFAVLSDDALRTLVDALGPSLAYAPSTPHFIIRPDGSWTELETGRVSTSALVSLLQQASGES